MKHRISQIKIFSLAFIAVLLAVNIQQPTSSDGILSSHKLSPVIAQMLVSANQKPIPVLIMKTNDSDAVEQLAESLGVTIRQRIHMLNAFAAEMPASALRQVAQHHDVKWVSPDGAMESSGLVSDTLTTDIYQLGSVSKWARTVKAEKAWNQGFTGKGIGIAIIDSGITSFADFQTPTNRIVKSLVFDNNVNNSTADDYGHGTHVASIIGGNGFTNELIGIAPEANLINLRVSNNRGQAKLSDVIAAMEWVLNNKNTHNIRVVNMSLNTTWAESYHTSPLDAAAEILWFNQIVVVTSAGNKGKDKVYAPGNDPFVITVGSTKMNYSTDVSDDTVSDFSSYGKTESGFDKPDLVAPGENVKGVMPLTSYLYQKHERFVSDYNIFKMSGTSVSAPIVTGVVALLLQKEPNLTPDQVKFRLRRTADSNLVNYSVETAGAGTINAQAALNTSTTASANTGREMSKLIALNGGSNVRIGSSVSWNSVSWNSVSWNSVSWNSVSWNSANWNSATSSSIFTDVVDVNAD